MRVDIYEIKDVQIQTKTSKAGKPYQVAHVTYRNNMGKLDERDVMPFGNQKNAFDKLSAGIPAGNYAVEVVKNDAGFLEWISLNPSEGGSVPAQAAAKATPSPAPKSTYETAEERALRQKLIVRQSSITNAIALFELDKKRVPAVQDVIQVAKQFEAFVFGHNTETDNISGIAEMEDDVPL